MSSEADKTTLDIQDIRSHFPLLHQQVNSYPLVYFDNAATSQKPQVVIDALKHYYERDNANVHRGVHTLSAKATLEFESVRSKVARFINASLPQECIFVRGTTEAINLVAHSYVLPLLKPQDEILITHMEHHANIVPWQIICQQTGAILRVAPISIDGEILLEDFEKCLNEKTRFVSITHASNVLGTINPIKQMIQMAHGWGAKVLIDGAQSIVHLPVDVKNLDCDFYAFSGHKMYAPTGIGVLWGRSELLERMRPYQGGGEMINTVSFESTDYAPIPYKFEAGTPNIAGVIGLGAALDYLSGLDMRAVSAYEDYLLHYATAQLKTIKGIIPIGCAEHKVPILSFIHTRIHAHDIGTLLDNEGIAVRSGHHCAMPLMTFLDLSATTRFSFSFYNTTDEIDKSMDILQRMNEVFA